jgi:outer membrane biosynthesis protein TonB
MFRFLNTKHKRKSAALTSVIMSLLLIALFFVGMTYLDPPQEYGIAVNFGTSSVGKGTVQPQVPIKSVPREVIEQPPQEVEETSAPEETEKVSDVSEEVVTQDLEESIAIKKEEERKRKAEEVAKKEREENERIEREKQAAIAKQKAEEEAKRKKLDALIGGINDSEGATTGGQGDDDIAGDKGKITGDPNADGFYGKGGSGGSGDYQLGNRKPLSRPKPNYICNEEGLVIVRIEVDMNGSVTKASAGVKGSTNTAECLLSQAQEAAMKTKWQADTNAPSKQVGTIKYRFSLSQ